MPYGAGPQKIALIVQNGDFITESDMRWACDYVLHWLEFAVEAVKCNVSDSVHEKNFKKIIGIIQRYQKRNNEKGMPHTDLSRATSKWIKKKERDDIIISLIEDEQIYVKTYDNKKSRFYFIYK